MNTEASPEHPTPTSRSMRAWLVLAITVLVALTLDLASKHYAFRLVADDPVVITRDRVLELPSAHINALIPAHEPVTVIPHLLELKLVLNPGAVFGLGAGGRWFFVAFTVAAIGFSLWIFARWTRPSEWFAHVGIGLIVAGGLGNFYDRMVYACVRDFLHPLYSLTFPGGRPVWPYVSNVADAFLLVGIAMLMLFLWRGGGAQPDGRATTTGDAQA
ncbi:MAG: signal peptidase II [Phycisphaeraceae bacterium]|nr:signal peptidase II [Phycisphaeraceae bacterium]